jgi:hypothetical protein
MRNPILFLTGRQCLMLSVAMILRMSVSGQCANNLGTKTYDTVLNGIGYGVYALRFPQWNPDSGTLISVKVSTRVQVQYGFTLTNADVKPSVYTLQVGREDHFTSPAIPSPFDNIIQKTIGAYALDPAATESQTPFLFLDGYTSSDSITIGTVPFLGTGHVDFTYSPITYTDLHTSNNASYNFHASAQDAMDFSVTYLYCNSQVALATGLTQWTAELETPAMVKLAWLAANEPAGRRYEIQRSPDGTTFYPVGAMQGAGASAGNASGGSGNASGASAGANDYVYSDPLPDPLTAPRQRNWYYRLRLDDGEHRSYSDVRVVHMFAPSPGSVRVYPNPAVNYIDLSLIPETSTGWQVDLYAADGTLVQSGNYAAASVIRMAFQRKMSPGTYFVRMTANRGKVRVIASFIVMGNN